VRLVLAIALAGLPGVALVLPHAEAATPTSYYAVASANGLDGTITNASIPAVTTIEVAGPTASATLASVGDSGSFASMPYPGDAVAGLPNLVGAIIPIPIPTYPLLVATSPGEPPADDNYPGITLHSETGDAVAEADGTFGASSTGGVSRAQSQLNGDGSVEATASAQVNGLVLGTELSLSAVSSFAQVVADGTTGKLTMTSSLSVGRLSLPGLSITIPTATPGVVPIPDPLPGVPELPPVHLPVLPIPLIGGMTIKTPDIGIEDGQFTITLPFLGNKTYAIPTTIVESAFKAAGVNVTFESADRSAAGVTAPAVRFAFTAPAPPSNPFFSGKSQVVVTVGGTSATVVLHPAGVTVGSPEPTGATGASGNAGSAAGSVPSLGPPISTSGTGSALPPDIAASGSAPPVASPQLALSADVGPDLSGLYLELVGVAVLAFIAALFLRLQGVRPLWKS
jgi:hypothetical protein